MASLQNIKLLILDNIVLKSYTLEESRYILEIAKIRYNKVSTILSEQIAHTKWYGLFSDSTIADAIMDRIIHNSYILDLDSKKSMREVMTGKIIKNIEKEDHYHKIKLHGKVSGCLRNMHYSNIFWIFNGNSFDY